jgi:uncharacterized protein with PQ loop repeat
MASGGAYGYRRRGSYVRAPSSSELTTRVLLLGLSLVLVQTLPQTDPPHPALRYLATFLGLSGTVLAICQYAPQMYRTYTTRLVGALSIGTMLIQVPGAVFFIISLAVRPGVDWTSWLAYAVTAGMQSALLVSYDFFTTSFDADIVRYFACMERTAEERGYRRFRQSARFRCRGADGARRAPPIRELRRAQTSVVKYHLFQCIHLMILNATYAQYGYKDLLTHGKANTKI